MDYLSLTKPRITLLVMLTTAFGFKLAGGEDGLWRLLAGAGLASAACGVLNQWLERDVDGRMKRTERRPLPSGRVDPRAALAYGLLLAVSGLALLDGLPRLLTAFTLVAYLMAYTPLKRISPQSTWVGAAAGATPPLIGWSAATGTLPPQAWALFGIQFLWQIPHFLALFWLYREDYARAGFKVMPVVDRSGGSTAAQIALHSFTVLPASLAPSFLGMAGPGYGLAALAVGAAYLGLGMRASWTLADADTRRLFLASLAYLPVLFIMLFLGGS